MFKPFTFLVYLEIKQIHESLKRSTTADEKNK